MKRYLILAIFFIFASILVGCGGGGSGVSGNGPSVITAVSGGDEFSLYLSQDGTVWASGRNFEGQLGQGITSGGAADIYSLVKVQGLSNVIAIAAGGQVGVALKSDGTVWTWGSDYKGELGNGFGELGYGVNCGTAKQVQGLSDIISIVAGNNHVLALKNDGTVWAWGWNVYGQIGCISSDFEKIISTPVKVNGISNISAIAAGGYYSLALSNMGSVYSWGQNSSGQLGNGNDFSSSIPSLVNTISGIQAISAGKEHGLALDNQGYVWRWGSTCFGSVIPSPYITEPVRIDSLTNVTKIAAGGGFSLVVKNDLTVWSQGYNMEYQLGIGPAPYIQYRSEWGQVYGLSNITSITGGWVHGLALDANGKAWGWGMDIRGQLGFMYGDNCRINTPTKIN